MVRWFSQASGIIIKTAWCSGPAPEVEEFEDLVEGRRVAGPGGHDGEGPLQPGDEGGGAQRLRARIQLRLPARVLISPLWAR